MLSITFPLFFFFKAFPSVLLLLLSLLVTAFIILMYFSCVVFHWVNKPVLLCIPCQCIFVPGGVLVSCGLFVCLLCFWLVCLPVSLSNFVDLLCAFGLKISALWTSSLLLSLLLLDPLLPSLYVNKTFHRANNRSFLFVCLVGDVYSSGMPESFRVCTLIDL